MSDRNSGQAPRRLRALWWLFGAVTSLAAAVTVLLYWLVHRNSPKVSIDFHPATSPSTAGQSPPGGTDGQVPPAPAGGDTGADGTGCDGSCNDSCNSIGSSVCDDLANDACRKPLDDTCGSADSCNVGSCNTGSSCDSGSGGCDSAGAGGQLTQLLAGGQPGLWMAVPRPRGRFTWPARIGVAVIRGYQRFLSVRLGAHCRYSPSCSAYGVAALHGHGALDGAMLTVARIRRCTAAVPCGTPDPVP
jgi:hypothetical protein